MDCRHRNWKFIKIKSPATRLTSGSYPGLFISQSIRFCSEKIWLVPLSLLQYSNTPAATQETEVGVKQLFDVFYHSNLPAKAQEAPASVKNKTKTKTFVLHARSHRTSLDP